MDFFGYDISDFITCEIPGCGQKAIDICHIEARSHFGKKKEDEANDIVNLMAKCRKHHEMFGDKKQFKEYLTNIHQAHICAHQGRS